MSVVEDEDRAQHLRYTMEQLNRAIRDAHENGITVSVLDSQFDPARSRRLPYQQFYVKVDRVIPL
jgi:hypothetical protein